MFSYNGEKERSPPANPAHAEEKTMTGGAWKKK